MSYPILETCGAALLLLFSATAAEARVTLKEPVAKTSPLAAGGTFAIENTNGGVEVEAWDRNEVQIQAEKRVEAQSDEIARKIMAEIKINIQADAGTVRVKTVLPRRDSGFFDWLTGQEWSAGVHYKVKVPRQARVEAESSNGGLKLTGTRGKATLTTTNGGLTVEQAAGDIRLNTVNGAIRVHGASGTVAAETTNGGIEVELTQVPDGSNLSFTTTNGGVTLRLPKDLRASLDASTSNGRITSDFEVEGGTPGRHSLTGDINGGGGRLKIRTTNGGVRIQAI